MKLYTYSSSLSSLLPRLLLFLLSLSVSLHPCCYSCFPSSLHPRQSFLPSSLLISLSPLSSSPFHTLFAFFHPEKRSKRWQCNRSPFRNKRYSLILSAFWWIYYGHRSTFAQFAATLLLCFFMKATYLPVLRQVRVLGCNLSRQPCIGGIMVPRAALRLVFLYAPATTWGHLFCMIAIYFVRR